jgi:hypothetical protein
VTFSRDGEEPEEMFASDGQRAWRNAITLIAKREWLLSGDTFAGPMRTLPSKSSDALKENRWRQI